MDWGNPYSRAKQVGGCGGVSNVARGGDDAEREEPKAS